MNGVPVVRRPLFQQLIQPLLISPVLKKPLVTTTCTLIDNDSLEDMSSR